jgi:hypothetical protein
VFFGRQLADPTPLVFASTLRKHMANQSKTFLEEEGDNYFRRNKSALDSAAAKWGEEFSDIDWLHQSLAPFQSEIGSVLEIGCANGIKVARICELLDAKGRGLIRRSLP